MTLPPRSAFRVTPQVILGLLIVGFGLILTAENLGIADAGHVFRYWPLVFVAFGLAKMLQSATMSGRIAGGIFLVFGGWMTAEELLGVRLDLDRWWPLFLVAFGGLILYRGVWHGHAAGPLSDRGTSGSTISEVAIWAGKKSRNTSPAFRRADLTAIMGGVELDLRGASTGGQEAIIDVFAWWGGIEITVPPDWAVSNRVVAFMGGASDESGGTQDSQHHLLVRGFVVMGGIEIKTK